MLEPLTPACRMSSDHDHEPFRAFEELPDLHRNQVEVVFSTLSTKERITNLFNRGFLAKDSDFFDEGPNRRVVCDFQLPRDSSSATVENGALSNVGNDPESEEQVSDLSHESFADRRVADLHQTGGREGGPAIRGEQMPEEERQAG